MLLILGDQLPESIVLALDLIHDVSARRGVVTGDQIRVPLPVIGVLDPPHRAIDIRAQRRHRVGCHAARARHS